MIYLYTDLTKKGLSDYQIKKKVSSNELYMIKKGAYSTTPNYNYLEYISKNHPNAVFTLLTACHCYGLYKTTKQFIEEANKVHNNRYDYSLTEI